MYDNAWIIGNSCKRGKNYVNSREPMLSIAVGYQNSKKYLKILSEQDKKKSFQHEELVLRVAAPL